MTADKELQEQIANRASREESDEVKELKRRIANLEQTIKDLKSEEDSDWWGKVVEHPFLKLRYVLGREGFMVMASKIGVIEETGKFYTYGQNGAFEIKDFIANGYKEVVLDD